MSKARSEHTMNVPKRRLGGGAAAGHVRVCRVAASSRRRGAHGAQSDQWLLNCRNHAVRPIGYITDTP
eukprot:2640493-Prymnesium_polylepis.1